MSIVKILYAAQTRRTRYEELFGRGEIIQSADHVSAALRIKIMQKA